MCIFAGLGTDYLRAYKIAFGNTKYTLKENQSSSLAIGLMIKIVYLSGIIGSLVGAVQVLRFLDDPTNFGVAISVAGLTLFYALFINIIQHAIKARVDKEVIYKENWFFKKLDPVDFFYRLKAGPNTQDLLFHIFQD